MLLGRASVYAGVQEYPLFTMSRMPPRERVSRAEKLLSCMDGALSAVLGRKAGGASRDRTGDLKLAKLALSQLSYGPDPAKLAAVEFPTLRPITSMWWAWEDLNFRPHAYQACALTT